MRKSSILKQSNAKLPTVAAIEKPVLCASLIYAKHADFFSADPQSASAVLYCCVLAVVACDENVSDREYLSADERDIIVFGNVQAPSTVDGVKDSFDDLFQCEKSRQHSNNDIIVTDAEDDLNYRYTKLSIGANTSSSVGSHGESTPNHAGLYFFERSALCRSYVSKVLRECWLPSQPLESIIDRGIKETEMLTFSSLSASDLYRCNQLQICDELLQKCVKPLPNFTGLLKKNDGEDGSVLKRRYFRNIPALSMGQLLTSELQREPEIVRQYYSFTDELVCTLLWPPPERRLGHKLWTPLASLSQEALAAAVAEDLRRKRGGAVRATARPKKGEKVYKNIVMSTADLMKFRQDTITITPAGKSIVMVQQCNSSRDAWVTVHLHGTIIGLRPNVSSAGKQKTSKANTAPGTALNTARGQADGTTATAAVAVVNGEDEAKPPLLSESSSAALLEASASDHSLVDDHTAGDHHHDEHAEHGADEMPHEETDTYGDHHDMTDVALTDFLPHPSIDLTNVPIPEPNYNNGGTFFCQTEDNVRIVAFAGQTLTSSRKPDKFGAVCVQVLTPNGLSVTACSNGIIKMSCEDATAIPLLNNAQLQAKENIGVEVARLMCAEGSIVRVLHNSPYCKDILAPDGTRILVKSKIGSIDELKGFHAKLLEDAPDNWQYIRMQADGRIFYYCSSDSTNLMPATGSLCTSFAETCIVSVDAETKARVTSYRDGRLRVVYADGLREVEFPDMTKMVTHPSGVMAVISKPFLPSIEVNLEMDNISNSHARGQQVPIAKGGDRIRSRIALLDGTGLMIKYDTRITATTNGSIKLVRRDRSTILVTDDGKVNYKPHTYWNDNAEKMFANECHDEAPPIAAPVAQLSSSIIVDSLELTVPVTVSVSRKLELETGTYSTINSTANSSKVNFARKTKSKTSVGSNTKLKQKSIDNSVSVMNPHNKDVFVNTEVQETIFNINFLQLTCKIEDFEHNCFDINLNQPMQPMVQLAGEVNGLKPTAVSDDPMEPRVFVINRSGAATEVLSVQDINELECIVKNCPDAHKTVDKACAQPSDLAAATQHVYFQQRRQGTYDAYGFEEVFAVRSWLDRDRPATALYCTKNKLPNAKTKASPRVMPACPRLYRTRLLMERVALSQAGYQKLTQDFAKWRKFVTDRVQAIDRFAVEDKRSNDELDEEDRVGLKLKQAYRVAKQQASKKKEKERDQAKQAAVSAAAEQSVTNALGVTVGGTLKEDDEEDGYLSGDSDVDDEVLEPEEAEIRAAFNDYAVVHGTSVSGAKFADSHEHHHKYIDLEELMPALIQVLNSAVSGELINRALMSLTLANLKSLELGEFRQLYEKLKQVINGEITLDEPSTVQYADVTWTVPTTPNLPDMENFVMDDYSNSVSPECSPAPRNGPSFWQDSAASNQQPSSSKNNRKPVAAVSVAGHAQEAADAPPLTSLASSPPPLNFNPLRISYASHDSGRSRLSSDHMDDGEASVEGQGQGVARGSAVQAIRRQAAKKH